MKITLEAYETKYTVETLNDDLDIYEYLYIIKRLLIQATFQESVIDNAIIELAEELTNPDN